MIKALDCIPKVYNGIAVVGLLDRRVWLKSAFEASFLCQMLGCMNELTRTLFSPEIILLCRFLYCEPVFICSG